MRLEEGPLSPAVLGLWMPSAETEEFEFLDEGEDFQEAPLEAPWSDGESAVALLRSFPATWLAPEVLPQLGARISVLLGKPLRLSFKLDGCGARFGKLVGKPKLLEDSTLGLVATVGFEERPWTFSPSLK